MDLPREGEMVRADDWDSDFPVNSNQTNDPFGSGFVEPNLRDFLDCSCGHVEGQDQLENQPQPSNFDFNTLLEDFDKEYGFAENHQNQQSNMVQNHGSSQEEGGLMMNDLAPNTVTVNGSGSFLEENSVMRYIPPLAPNNFSMINHHVWPLQETTGMMDYIPPIVERDMMMEELLAPYSTKAHDLVTPHGHAISLEQQNAVGRGLGNIPRPNLTYCKGAKLRVRWTPALHACFLSAVKQLGGPESATPKNIASLMNIPGLNRYHIKSHLQKYRNGGHSSLDNLDRNNI